MASGNLAQELQLGHGVQIDRLFWANVLHVSAVKQRVSQPDLNTIIMNSQSMTGGEPHATSI